jgi:hypothetical protein
MTRAPGVLTRPELRESETLHLPTHEPRPRTRHAHHALRARRCVLGAERMQIAHHVSSFFSATRSMTMNPATMSPNRTRISRIIIGPSPAHTSTSVTTRISTPLDRFAGILAIEAYTRRGTGTVRIITPYGSLTVDQILGRQGEMLAADARATIRGEPLPERDPLRLLAKLRALRDSGAISGTEFEIRKSPIWRDI